MPVSAAPFLFTDGFLLSNTAHFALGYKPTFLSHGSQFAAYCYFFSKSAEQLLLRFIGT
jgi:hypothetical protein